MHAEESTESTEVQIAALRSSTPAWKEQMLARLSGHIPQAARIRRNNRRFFARLAIAAAAACGIVALATSSTSALWLLSHSEERTFEYRLSGERYAPVHVVRGTSKTDDLGLTAAKLLISLREKVSSGAAAWSHVRGRAALAQTATPLTLDSAVDTLTQAQLVSPLDASIANDLGVALLLRAELGVDEDQQRAEDVARSIEIFHRAIQARPSAILYFNLALAYEHQQTYGPALDTWNEFLRREASGGWAEEARRHVSELGRRRAARSSAGRRNSEDAITGLAGREFVASSTVNPAAIAEDLATGHGDPWMKEMLVARSNSAANSAFSALGESVRDFLAGDATTGEIQARRAAALFNAAGQPAGWAIASFERAYTLQRLSRPGECVELARSVLPAVETHRYRWMETQLRLTLAICLELERNYTNAYNEVSIALTAANSAQYPSLELRIIGVASGLQRDLGSYRQALPLDANGLRRYWSGEGTSTNAYQFYYGYRNRLLSRDSVIPAPPRPRSTKQWNWRASNRIGRSRGWCGQNSVRFCWRTRISARPRLSWSRPKTCFARSRKRRL